MADIFTPNPLSLQVLPSWDSQAVDLVWKKGSTPKVVGYNVYRAQGAPSNFKLITEQPLQTTFFRDTTRLVPMSETPSQWVSPPDASIQLTAIRTKKTPISRSVLDNYNKPVLANNQDVQVVNSETNYTYQIQRVDPNNGLIVFGNQPLVAESMDRLEDVQLPKDLSKLVVSYFYVDRFTDSTFGKDLFYIVTEVFSDGSEGALTNYPPISNLELDPADIYWREGMRRNRFIFEQVGEAAYIILKKTTGHICTCVDTDTMKPRTNCTSCWGVGYQGGYDGPYPITFTPPNAPASVKQGPDGKYKTRSAQSFIGPSPILTSGDIIFRFSGERLVVLDVERTSIRGTTLQQSYNAELLRPADFRNQIQIVNRNYPTIVISSSLPTINNTEGSYTDPIPANISLHEGISTVEISDPTLDVTKVENELPDNIRENTIPSKSPVFENYNF